MLILELTEVGFGSYFSGFLGFKWKYIPFESKIIAPEWFIETISSPFM
jgi:hypothetical protein